MVMRKQKEILFFRQQNKLAVSWKATAKANLSGLALGHPALIA